ncbi:PAS/PAC sensor signal transduction histidine kinase [Sulfuricurvum kujiense DSM 16994]|uniref:histidine kinase n=1 Tax=Sulfuricurvum kujiense (strain ATCC BAA-921 / DSM 16994 / JCM 11577 / YK-1) TaxID=709032 RepID=E4TWM7_SULKY|nr:PAS domain S-box protein [Sulfuricurvum kujiense]ADR34873.1 PAS/PAC sensor signal transduction histidine kinase [Sulfuricurvum kujiense DSM 16994]
MEHTDSKSSLERIAALEKQLSEYQQIERQLRESEEKYRQLFDSSRDALMTITSPSWKYTEANKAALELFGVANIQEFTTLGPWNVSPLQQPDGRSSVEKAQEMIATAIQEGSNAFEWEHQRMDGQTFASDVLLTRLELDGQILVQATVRDISERKIAEQSLRESEEKFHSITVSAQDAILMMNDEGNISYWNEAAERMFGYSESEIMGWPLHEMLAPERFLEAHHKAFGHFKKTGEGAAVGKTLELVALKKDNTEFPIELSLSAVMSNGHWNAIGIIRDITERKKMELELKQKEEMMIAQSKQAAMGDMIAMIAHQWRQPLAIMGMEINNLIMSIGFDDEITNDYLLKLSESLNKQLHQLSETIDNFRNFFMPTQSRVQITMEEVLENTLNIIGASCENSNIKLNVQNSSKSSLFITKSSLIQVLLNIVGNAKDMLLANQIKNAAITVTVSETDETISISVCDNAGGIPESICDKIGQPYFTTKKDLNGTGLGVYISRIIIEKHLFGTLRWYNKEGGACFEITLKINPD